MTVHSPEQDPDHIVQAAVDALGGHAYPPIHCLLYGESGAGKSTFLSTFPKPMLVMGFDPYDKMAPYTRYGKVVPLSDPAVVQEYQKLGIEAKDVVHKQTGDLLIRIEHYVDADPARPNAFNAFETRMVSFASEASQWATVGLDSLTFLMRASMVRAQYNKPMQLYAPGTDTRQWYGMVKFDIESVLMSRAPWWDTNVVICCHTKEDKDEFAEGVLRGIRAPGTLSKDGPAGFGETYRAHIAKTKEKDGSLMRKYMLQTRSDTLWFANSVVCQAPDPCEAHYVNLWANFEG